MQGRVQGGIAGNLLAPKHDRIEARSYYRTMDSSLTEDRKRERERGRVGDNYWRK